MNRKLVLKLAREIHLARLRECSFPGHPGYTGYDAAYARQPWPEDRKEAERLLQAGQTWMEIAIAQAEVVLKTLQADGLLKEG